MKTLLQGLAAVVLFFLLWLTLSQLNWRSFFKVDKAEDETAEQLGELFLDSFMAAEEEIDDTEVLFALDSLLVSIADSNDIERESITLHVVKKDEVNAFALPNRHIVIYSGLIKNAEAQEELIGVLSHEIAHLELNHIMKKLIKEVGLSVLISVATGNGNVEVINQALKLLSSSAFDRSMEKEADIKAIDYMLEVNVNPNPFIDFLYLLGSDDAPEVLSWISTHPQSKERASYLVNYVENHEIREVDFKPVLTDSVWLNLQERLDY